jgi:hypothetical protein
MNLVSTARIWTMADKESTVETSKKVAALRQIRAAIAHLNKGELECAITLAGAAEGQIPESIMESLFRLIQRKLPGAEINKVRDWLKHKSGPDTATISEFEAALMISSAIKKFVGAYGFSHPDFEKFSTWAVEKGHLPRPLTLKVTQLPLP